MVHGTASERIDSWSRKKLIFGEGVCFREEYFLDVALGKQLDAER